MSSSALTLSSSYRWGRSARRGEAFCQLTRQLGPHKRVMPRYEGVAARRRQPLQATDRLNGALWGHTAPPADRELVLDVLRQVRGVEREDQTATADRLVEVDDKALMSRRVSGGEHRGDAGRDLAVALGQMPLDGRVVVVDAEHGVV